MRDRAPRQDSVSPREPVRLVLRIAHDAVAVASLICLAFAVVPRDRHLAERAEELREAAEFDREGAVARLLAGGVRADASEPRRRMTPLMYAAGHGHDGVVRAARSRGGSQRDL